MGPEVPLRILIVRLSAIGDVVLNLPVLCALRARFPDAFLAWIVERPSAPLLEGHPALDRLLVVPKGWLRSPRALLRLRRELRALDCNVALDLQGLTKSSLAAWMSGARRRIGFAPSEFEGRELSCWIDNERIVPRHQHVVERGLDLLRPLGVEQPVARFDLPIDPSAGAAADRTIDALGLHAGFAVLNPGAGWASKLWPLERFAAVARHLGTVHHLRSLVVWAGETEHGWAQQIVASADGHGKTAPRTSLVELAALVARARVVVSSDTGPLHLAAAVGAPCVGLFGPMPASRCAPYGPDHIAIQQACLSGPSRARRNAGNETMRAIGVEQVCAACDRILATRRLAA